MQRPETGGSEEKDVVRVLDSRAVLSHYAHVQAGRRSSVGCGWCQKGMAGISSEAEIEVPTDSVVPDSGTDKKEDAALPPPRGWVRDPYGRVVPNESRTT